jgi:hypothetical protein
MVVRGGLADAASDRSSKPMTAISSGCAGRLGDGLQRADRHRVGCRKERIRWSGQAQQAAHGVIAAVVVEKALDDQLFIDGLPTRTQRLQIPSRRSTPAVEYSGP